MSDHPKYYQCDGCTARMPEDDFRCFFSQEEHAKTTKDCVRLCLGCRTVAERWVFKTLRHSGKGLADLVGRR